MCDEPVPCQCTLDRRVELRRQHIELHDRLSNLAYRLWKEGHVNEEERDVLFSQAEEAWDDAIHIADPTDPLRSLCGSYGRNLCDLPEVPDKWGGCWGCMDRAAKMMKPEAAEVELAHA